MDNTKFDNLCRTVLDIMNFLENSSHSLILKSSYDIDSNLVSFMSLLATNMLKH
jgi:hypothetical protein